MNLHRHRMDDSQLNTAEQVAAERPWRLVDLIMSSSGVLSELACLVCVVVLAGYLIGHESLYRPIVGGPGTHPLTATFLFLGAFSILLIRLFRSGTRFAMWLAIGSLSLLFVEAIGTAFPDNLLDWMKPFSDRLAMHELEGHPIHTGANTVVMLTFIMAALVCFHYQFRAFAQLLGFMAAGLPSIALAGYAYGLSDFYGEMSLLTAIAGLMLSLAVMAITAEHGALRAILSPYRGGWLFRLQVLITASLPGVMGYLMIDFMSLSDGSAVGATVIGITWFSLILVGVSALYIEHVDAQRRESERMLLHAALNDQLTGLPNRRRFFQFGEYEIERSQRTQGQLWLLMLDLDFFKTINDEAGHDMGDRILVAVAEAMESSIRGIDLACRLGGEEFAILLVDASEEGVLRVAESIREKVQAIRIPACTDRLGPVTVSIGGIQVDSELQLDAALKGADNALYLAKRQGRNQVVLASSGHRESGRNCA